MIEIKIEAASGAEARAELLNLLGVTSGVAAQQIEAKIDPAQLNVALEARPEPVVNEAPTRKRRTQAEIKAEEAAKVETPTQEEPPATEVKEETPVENEAKEETPAKEVPTLQDLQRECAILVRAGYKEDGVKFIKTVGGAENSKEVPEEKREAVIAAMAAFIEENKISR